MTLDQVEEIIPDSYMGLCLKNKWMRFIDMRVHCPKPTISIHDGRSEPLLSKSIIQNRAVCEPYSHTGIQPVCVHTW